MLRLPRFRASRTNGDAFEARAEAFRARLAQFQSELETAAIAAGGGLQLVAIDVIEPPMIWRRCNKVSTWPRKCATFRADGVFMAPS